MLPQLKQMMSSMPPDFGEEEDFVGFPFGVIPPPTENGDAGKPENPQSKI